MCSNFNQQLKIECCVNRMLYMNSTVTTNKNPITDAQKIKRNESNITLKRTIRSQGKGVGEEERNTEEQKTHQKTVNKMEINTYL